MTQQRARCACRRLSVLRASQPSPQDPIALLRERVTSKGGTTAAALASLDADGVKQAIVKAVRAASVRARELGDESAL